MSTTTGGDLNLTKPALTDDHKVTIGTDLPANFQKIDDKVSEHLAETVQQENGAHGLKIESGTWTPVLSGTTTAGTNTYSKQVGEYYKIGKLVFVSARLWLSAKDAAMAGNIVITGLPFVAASAAVAINAQWGNIDLNDTTPQLTPTLYAGDARIRLSTSGDNIGSNWINQTAISANTTIDLSCVYTTS